MHSLSSRLLILTIFFVMLAEVFIFVPSIARFREAWIDEKLGLGHLAILALDATPDRMVSEMLRTELLTHVGAYALFVRRGGARLVLSSKQPPPIAHNYYMRDATMFTMIANAFSTLLQTENRVIRIVGPSPKDPSVTIELILNEAPLHNALVAFAWRIFGLSLVISLITAMLVFFSLQWLMVRPLRRLTANMIAFREDPEDPRRVIEPSRRQDEIGTAQRELAGMQERLRDTLKQRAHLAALGTAVAKINHDLRGILASALLVSDRLSNIEDPEVRRVTPTLFASIDRAVKLCTRTLNFVGQDQPTLEHERFSLHELVAEVEAALAPPEGRSVQLENTVAEAVELNADHEQLFRALDNLMRNAAEAGADRITVGAKSNGRWVEIDVQDNGPGLPPKAQEKLFRPFEGSARAGGSGLGLAIARELVRNHGGELKLMDTGQDGTTFRIALPLT